MDAPKVDPRHAIDRGAGVFDFDLDGIIDQHLFLMQVNLSARWYQRAVLLHINPRFRGPLSSIRMYCEGEAVMCTLPDDNEATNFDVKGSFVLRGSSWSNVEYGDDPASFAELSRLKYRFEA